MKKEQERLLVFWPPLRSLSLGAPRNGLSAEYRGHHEGEGWRTDERVNIGADGRIRASLDGEVRRELRSGTTVDARGTVSSDGTLRGEAGLEHRVSEGLTLSERVRVDEDGVRSHTHGDT